MFIFTCIRDGTIEQLDTSMSFVGALLFFETRFMVQISRFCLRETLYKFTLIFSSGFCGVICSLLSIYCWLYADLIVIVIVFQRMITLLVGFYNLVLTARMMMSVMV